MVLTALWSAADLASPAYRVTVPCVVHIAYMRQKGPMKANSATCQTCSSVNANTAKFCSDCGHALV